jgi:hypothetical protein
VPNGQLTEPPGADNSSSSSSGTFLNPTNITAASQDATASNPPTDGAPADSFTFSKNNVTQVVITSFKLSPVTVEQLSKIAGPGEAAVAWQEGLQDTLSNATANATGVPLQQVQTKISSVLNLVSCCCYGWQSSTGSLSYWVALC